MSWLNMYGNSIPIGEQLRTILNSVSSLIIVVGLINLIPCAVKIASCIFGVLYSTLNKYQTIGYYFGMASVAIDAVATFNAFVTTIIIVNLVTIAQNVIAMFYIPEQFSSYTLLPSQLSGWVTLNFVLVTLPAFISTLIYFVFFVKISKKSIR